MVENINFYDAILRPLQFLLNMFNNLMNLTCDGFGNLTVFNIALTSFIIYSLFRFIINPLFSASFKWNDKGDKVSDSIKNESKTDFERYIERVSLNYWRR